MRSREENTEYFRERRKSKKNINIEINKETSDLLDNCLKEMGITKKQWLDSMINATIYKNGFFKAKLFQCQTFPDMFACIYTELKKENGASKEDILLTLKELDTKISKKDMELLKNYLN